VRIDAVDEEGKTALMFAVETGQIHLVKYLLDAGANVDVIDKNGLTALRMAKANYSEDIVELLRQHKK
jgi:ankyrin repeat protein